MRTFKITGELNQDPIATLSQLETDMGIKLHVIDPKKPNDVQGYLNTGSDGEIEVNLYESKELIKPIFKVSLISDSAVSLATTKLEVKVNPIVLEV